MIGEKKKWRKKESRKHQIRFISIYPDHVWITNHYVKTILQANIKTEIDREGLKEKKKKQKYKLNKEQEKAKHDKLIKLEVISNVERWIFWLWKKANEWMKEKLYSINGWLNMITMMKMNILLSNWINVKNF